MRNHLRILVVLFLIAVLIAGCTQPNGQQNGEQKVDYKLIGDETKLSREANNLLEVLRERKGYFTYIENGQTYLFIMMGEQKTGGYELSLESVQGIEGRIEIKVKETVPKETDVVTEVLTYPHLILALDKTNKEFNIKNQENWVYPEINLNEEVKIEEGQYIGQIDGSSIEIKIGEEFKAFRLNMELRSTINDFMDGSPVKVTYYQNQYGQLMIIKLEKVS